MRLMYFHADWCGPCKSVGPIIKEIEDEGYEVERIDIDKQADIAKKYNVMSIPTVLAFSGDKEIGREVGFVSKANIRSLLD